MSSFPLAKDPFTLGEGSLRVEGGFRLGLSHGAEQLLLALTERTRALQRSVSTVLTIEASGRAVLFRQQAQGLLLTLCVVLLLKAARKLQLVQNAAEHLLSGGKEHTAPVLTSLHRFPVSQSKMLALAF